MKSFSPAWSLRLVLIDIPVLVIAVILDVLGLLCFFFSFVVIGIPLSYILDAVGMVVIGLWSFFRGGKMPITKRFLRLLKRPTLALVGEIIPFFGDIVFCWTIFVIYEMATSD